MKKRYWRYNNNIFFFTKHRCGIAFEKYTSGSECDGEIHNFVENFEDFANFNAEVSRLKKSLLALID